MLSFFGPVVLFLKELDLYEKQEDVPLLCVFVGSHHETHCEVVVVIMSTWKATDCINSFSSNSWVLSAETLFLTTPVPT